MEVYLLGKTEPNMEEVSRWLKDQGWSWNGPATASGLVELYGRSCYDSFEGTSNKNITRIRKDHNEYIANIIKVAHGSVLEHATWNFMFCGVSRVLTHELVRHRQGTAFSQQSGRYVRLNNLDGMYCPPEIAEYGLENWWEQTLLEIGGALDQANVVLDSLDAPFDVKKKLTSAVRRMAPNGVDSNIGFTVNARALRFILQQRTDPAAEVEIRVLFNKVWELVKHDPLMQCETEMVDGLLWVKGGKA